MRGDLIGWLHGRKNHLLIHIQAQTKAQAWKMVHYLVFGDGVRPFFKLVLWFVLGRGSLLYDSSLV